MVLGNLSDWVIVIVIAVILFGGASKIPELFRNLGRAVGELKRGQMEVQRELEKELQANQTQLSQANNSKDQAKVQELEAKIRELQAELERVKGNSVVKEKD